MAGNAEFLNLAWECKVPESHAEVLYNFDVELFSRVAADASALDGVSKDLFSENAVPESATERV